MQRDGVEAGVAGVLGDEVLDCLRAEPLVPLPDEEVVIFVDRRLTLIVITVLDGAKS